MVGRGTRVQQIPTRGNLGAFLYRLKNLGCGTCTCWSQQTSFRYLIFPFGVAVRSSDYFSLVDIFVVLLLK